LKASPSASLNFAGGASSQASWSIIMTTQNSFYFRILVVWLVFFVFLFGMIVPSSAHAKKEMTIATEGDPGDGLGAQGGGGSIFGLGDNESSNGSSIQIFGDYKPVSVWVFEVNRFPIMVVLFPLYEKGIFLEDWNKPDWVQLEAIR
jgi:hypothetical protein